MFNFSEYTSIVTVNNLANTDLKIGDILKLNITTLVESEPIEVEIPINKNMILKREILLIYNYKKEKDFTIAKAALLGFEACDSYIIDGIPIIICINRMF